MPGIPQFRNAGQTCISANRFYVHRSQLYAFGQRLAERVADIQLGEDEETDAMGPLINQKAVEKVQRHLEDVKRLGGNVLCGGRAAEKGACYFHPTIAVMPGPADNDDACVNMREETFGPIAIISSFDSEDEVIQRANATEGGLVAYVHGHDYHQLARVSDALDFGMKAVNVGKVSNAHMPFGGVKQSGYGREGGFEGLEEFFATESYYEGDDRGSGR